MDSRQAERLLKKYWEGTSSLNEEAALKQFFAYGAVPEHLERYRELFSGDEVELNPDLGLDFDREVMARIEPSSSAPKRRWIGIAASGLILIGIAVGTYIMDQPQAPLAEDTYQDPEKALAETKKALAMLSDAFQKGESQVIVIGELDRTRNKIENEHP